MKEREDQVMKVSKKVISNLTKCYSIAPLTYQGKRHILVAAEKQDPCLIWRAIRKRQYGKVREES